MATKRTKLRRTPKTVPMASRGTRPASSVMPKTKAAPEPTFPIAVNPTPGVLAPPPLIDRYPLVQGQQLTFTYLASIFRLATTGYRQQFVDLLRELVENDGHLLSVLQKRILAVANGRIRFTPAVDEGHPESELAKEVCELCEIEVLRIPNLTQSLATLLWAIYYAASCAEIIWSRDTAGWHVDRLEFVHSRRISWPDSQSWDAYIWDQGQVYGWQSPWGAAATNSGVFGLRIGNWPGKFVFYAPQIQGDYPTRDGLGRQAAIFALFKRIGVRGASSYLERFAKGFMDVSYKTSHSDEHPDAPREATADDIAIANQIAAALGPGSGSYAAHPDSISISPQSFDGGSSTKITWQEWIGLCNAEMSKLVLGGTLGTEVGKGGGNRALGEVMERGEVELQQFDATTLAETLKRDLVSWIVRLNRPDAIHLVPNIAIHTESDPDPKALIENAERVTGIGGAVDLDQLAEDTGVPLVPNETGKPRRSFKSDMIKPELVQDDLLSPEAKKQAAVDSKAKLAAATRSQVVAPTPSNGADTDDDQADDAKPDPKKAPAAKPNAKPSGKVAPKPSKSSKSSPKDKAEKAEKPSKVKKATDGLSCEEVAQADAFRKFLLSSKRDDKEMAYAVYEELLEDYPPAALDWILAAHWEGPMEIPLDQIDFSQRKTWRADTDDLTPYRDRLNKALAGNGPRKPVIIVKTPGNPLYLIVDGHHRTLACLLEGVPAWAYVAEVHVDNGPWRRLHAEQKRGSSKNDTSVVGSSHVYSPDGDDGLPEHDDES
jgi:phage gp29-like protein